ncbi:hypothetical protein [Lysinibacillus sp. FJAT-14745]|uniref:hypothetical protein n=1 Tax=Lysinibacillus sp. FJAT-14745 TaxID=1704289 RepID=UPI0012E17052|nr:hypothetical protein [Lysinibacillus sp. FJAT-14745]
MAKGAKEVLVEGGIPNSAITCLYGLNFMKDSLKQFLEYDDSDEELAYYIRMNAEWNEESFIKMQQLVRKVMEDYSDEDYYYKPFVYYCVEIIRIIIGTISHEAFCSGRWPEGFTRESYRDFLDERIEQLKLIQKDFIRTL